MKFDVTTGEKKNKSKQQVHVYTIFWITAEELNYFEVLLGC